ncbi:MAG: DUF2335 domain-containing protein [Verrucomicrobiia bacterium]|jgi:uncharacterized membrane protein
MAGKSNQPPQGVQTKSQSGPTDVDILKQFERTLEATAPGVLNNIPRDKRRALFLASVQVTETLVVRRGPLPDPDDLAKYGQIIPEGADRIMRMAEDQSKHRIAIETTVINSQQIQSRRGQVFGLIIGIFGIIAGAVVALLGHDAVGGVIAGTTVVSLVVAFVTGRRVQQKELQEKRPQ